jgi:hypothetical protein
MGGSREDREVAGCVAAVAVTLTAASACVGTVGPPPLMLIVEVPMLDAGGDAPARDSGRPLSRPLVVWIVVPILVGYGALGGYAASLMFVDVVDYGWSRDVQRVAFASGALMYAGLVVTGVALFAGARWGRAGALRLCAASGLLAAVGGLTQTLSGFQVWLVVVATLVLLLVLLGPGVHAWTGGDREGAGGPPSP